MRSLRRNLGLVVILWLFSAAFSFAGSPGSFRGKVVESEQTAADPNWLYVQGRNGLVRRVEISHAKIEYDDSVPEARRKTKPLRALVSGTEVRVTAEQGSDGEWRATRVEILSGGTEAVAKEVEKGKS